MIVDHTQAMPDSDAEGEEPAPEPWELLPIWGGTNRELDMLMDILDSNSSCEVDCNDTGIDRQACPDDAVVCPSHSILTNQRILDGLIYIRRRRLDWIMREWMREPIAIVTLSRSMKG